MQIDRLDHFVIHVQNLEVALDFYARVLGLEVVTFGDNAKAVQIGSQKINVHQASLTYTPEAAQPVVGSGDFCLITKTPLTEVIAHLHSHGVEIELGPVPRTGAQGPMQSVYVRDPDGNLVEIAHYPE